MTVRFANPYRNAPPMGCGYQGDVAPLDTASTYAPIASPILTGDPQAPTPPPGDNDTSVATTAFVSAAITAAPNQTITLSGDLTGSGTTSINAQIAANAVGTTEVANAAITYAKIQNITNNRVLGNTSGSAAAPAEIALPLSLANGGTGTTNAAGLPYLPIAGGTLSGSLAVGGNTNPALDIYGGQFTALHAPDATGLATGIFVGLLANPVNYYANGTHAFYDRAVATNYVTMAAAGTTVGAPTGGAKGAGTLNAVGVYAQGTLLTSDMRLKRDVTPLSAGCLDLVTSIAPKRYSWKEPDVLPLRLDGESSLTLEEYRPPGFFERRHTGFIAQEVRSFLPDAVEADAEGNLSYDPAAMVAVLWRAVQELAAEVADLKRAAR